MNNKPNTKTTMNTIEIYESLRTAMDSAGGCCSIYALFEMTAIELMNCLAPNHIRFVFNKNNDDD